jgi:Nucleotidyltransferase of unknown function (DUF6036)
MTPVESLLHEIDTRWKLQAAAKIPLHFIGSTALLLQTQYNRGTKDGDVLETAELVAEARDHLLELAGEHTSLHKRHRLYIDIVSNGLPFLPHPPKYHPVQSLASLLHFEVFTLDVIDIVVSKFKRFHANDQADIIAMIDADHVPHAKLIERFRSAFDVFLGDARAEELPRYVRNLNRIERDQFEVDATEFEYPEWVG